MVFAPNARAIAFAAMATPPPMPQINTVSPSFNPALVTSMRYAVTNTRGNAAASSKLIPFGDRVDVLPRHGHELRVRPVHVLAVHGDVIAVIDPGVQDHAVTGSESGPALDDPGAVGSQDAGLGRGRPAAPHPQVDVVERGRAQPDQDVARSRLGIGGVFVAQHLGAAVLVDPNRLQAADRNQVTLCY